MNRRRALDRLAWWLGPALAGAVGLTVGQLHLNAKRGIFQRATAALSMAEQRTLEAAPALAAANAVWAFGNYDAVHAMMRAELDRLADSDPRLEARVLVRWGIIDPNPEGKAAVFSQACALDKSLCDHMKEAAQREIDARFVEPGDHLPLYLIGGHPPIPRLP